MFLARFGLLAATLLALAGCASTEIKNLPLAAGEKNPAVSSFTWAPDRPFVLVAFSGGGSRAAAMAYYTMLALNAVPDGIGNETLLDDVAIISSVSGGSIASAYFGLHGKAGLPDFYSNFLAKDNMSALEGQLLNPIIDTKLLVGAMDRADAEQHMYDNQLFHGATYAALQARQTPIVLLNATDMASGNVFDFGPSRFDDICSNLSKLPISVAVTSSSAFPILLSPVTLQNYSAQPCAGQRLAAGPRPPDIGVYQYPQQYAQWLYTNDLRHGANPRADIKYVHLLDGGLADNLGVTTLQNVLTTPDADAPALELLNSADGPKKIVVIVVRARSFVQSDLYGKAATPGEIGMISAVTGVPLDANTDSLNQNENQLITTLQMQTQQIAQAYGTAAPQISDVDLDPSQLQGPEAALGTAVEAIPTAYTVTPCQLQNIDQAVQDLLENNPDFQKLVTSLGRQFHAMQPSGKVCVK